ncbi:hypothetical protein [Luteibaculum oceani]|uniref:Cupin domain-containing protein n=1 Tax=Luteibaculum oceani TaxID=1294296 RepID=A0A5C6VPR9_9FLAO|nr:hypothetical protein [Luteibaculum oceani]TXC85318.1 hypothetical protein FRX97_01450 [Luteibaculum oceani]
MDLSVLANSARTAHTALPVFTCNNHVVELVLNRNFEESWQCFVNSQAFYLVLDGELEFLHANGARVGVKKGEYIIVDKGNPFQLTDTGRCNYLTIHQKDVSGPHHKFSKSHSEFIKGNLFKDLKFKPLELNDHQIQLLTNQNNNTDEAFVDSDRTVFVMDGEMTIADVYGELTLKAQETVNIPAYDFHRLFIDENSRGFTFQQKDARMVFLSNQ